MKAPLPTGTVAELGIGVQAWLIRDEPDSSRSWRPARDQPRSKPTDGTFTCSWDAERRSTYWLDHLRAIGSDDRKAEPRSLWLLNPDAEARLYVIDSVTAYDRLANAFPKRWNEDANRLLTHADWNAIADPSDLQFDGVHATQGAIVGGPPRFTGWEVESTLWFRWCFTACECIGRVRGEDLTIDWC